jgi:hypothetical protein
MSKCIYCGDTGVIETGNNDLPCSCIAGETAKFNLAGVEGSITGAELSKHFLNNSPHPIDYDIGFRASDIPGRRLY